MNNSILSLQADISPNITLVAAILFAVMFVAATAFVAYLVIKLKKTVEKHNAVVKKLEALLIEKERTVKVLNTKLIKVRNERNGLQQEVVNLTAALTASQEQAEQQQGELQTLNEKIIDMQNRLEEAKQYSESLQTTTDNPIRQTETTESAGEGQFEIDKHDQLQNEGASPDVVPIDNEEMINLKKQVESLLSENEQLRRREEERNKGYTIEDYFPAIDAAFEYADSCKFDQNNPRGSFATQRQQLNEIRKWLDAYRSQRR